jgi:uncharacterized protein (DUF1778 family)
MAGRKKKPESESKSYMLRIRMTEKERDLLEEAAKSKSLETSTWVRSEIVALAKRIIAKKTP